MRTFYRYLLLGIGGLASITALAQQPFQSGKYNYIWVTGVGDTLGGNKISHHTSPPTISEWYPNLSILWGRNYASLCDSAGHFLCYSNGLSVYNALDSLMENGNGITVDPDDGLQSYFSQSVMLPPSHDSSHIIRMLHKKFQWTDYFYYMWEGELLSNYLWSSDLMLTTIDMSANNGLGKVIEKNVPIIQDTLEQSRVNPVRHANGRDWWMPVFRATTGEYYRVLIQPDTIMVLPIMEVSRYAPDGSCSIGGFTPDGTKYIRMGNIGTGFVTYISVYDFNRCDGTLSFNQMFTTVTDGYPGMALSPNSRFLYFNAGWHIYQYDLWADSIKDSKTQIYFNPDIVDRGFGHAFTAPDGVIYIPDGYQFPYMHTIEFPNNKGNACGFQFEAFELLTYSSFVVNSPTNYNLGPLDGSACDTLGLDNHPQAHYRWKASSNNPKKIFFEDNSIMNPTSWSWNFGDGTAISQDTSPAHTYAQNGQYEVCLTVSNQNASNTYCEMIPVGATDSENPTDNTAAVWPNPCTDALHVRLPAQGRACVFVLYNSLGQEMLRQPIATYFINRLSTEALPRGVYVFELRNDDGILQSGKVVKE